MTSAWINGRALLNFDSVILEAWRGEIDCRAGSIARA